MSGGDGFDRWGSDRGHGRVERLVEDGMLIVGVFWWLPFLVWALGAEFAF